MKRFATIFAVLMFFLAIGLSHASANTFQYTISGDAYGCIGGPQGSNSCPGQGTTNATVGFSAADIPLNLTMTEDNFGSAAVEVPFTLSIIGSQSVDISGDAWAQVLSATFTSTFNSAGAASFNFADNYYLVDAQSGLLGFGYGFVDDALSSDYMDLSSALFNSYDLTQAPSRAVGVFGSPNFQDVSNSGFFAAFVCPNCVIGGGDLQPGTTTFTLLGTNNLTFSATPYPPVPEPASLALFGSGLIAVTRKALKKR